MEKKVDEWENDVFDAIVQSWCVEPNTRKTMDTDLVKTIMSKVEPVVRQTLKESRIELLNEVEREIDEVKKYDILPIQVKLENPRMWSTSETVSKIIFSKIDERLKEVLTNQLSRDTER